MGLEERIGCICIGMDVSRMDWMEAEVLAPKVSAGPGESGDGNCSGLEGKVGRGHEVVFQELRKEDSLQSIGVQEV